MSGPLVDTLASGFWDWSIRNLFNRAFKSDHERLITTFWTQFSRRFATYLICNFLAYSWKSFVEKHQSLAEVTGRLFLWLLSVSLRMLYVCISNLWMDVPCKHLRLGTSSVLAASTGVLQAKPRWRLARIHITTGCFSLRSWRHLLYCCKFIHGSTRPEKTIQLSALTLVTADTASVIHNCMVICFRLLQVNRDLNTLAQGKVIFQCSERTQGSVKAWKGLQVARFVFRQTNWQPCLLQPRQFTSESHRITE